MLTLTGKTRSSEGDGRSDVTDSLYFPHWLRLADRFRLTDVFGLPCKV